MAAKILTIDIETQRAIVETFGLFPNYIHIDRVHTPERILCFAAQWHGEEKILFSHSWEDGDDESYRAMLKDAWKLLDEADFVVTWNGDRFDLQWLQAEFGRLELGPPSPFKSLDLIKVAKKHFSKGLMSKKLDWQARTWLGDRKVHHGGVDLWHDIRYGTRKQKREAQKTMKTYCMHDTRLTDGLLDRYLPWTNVNLSLFESNDDGRLHCVKCNSTRLKLDGRKFYATTASLYQMHRCKDCGATSRGSRSVHSNELRSATS